MTFLQQEINFDLGHIILILALVFFVIFVSQKCKLSCSYSDKEGLTISPDLDIQPVYWKPCRCENCNLAALDKAKNGYLYGCDPNNPIAPFSREECNYQYRKAALHGCDIA
jgi:hypothetical protein